LLRCSDSALTERLIVVKVVDERSTNTMAEEFKFTQVQQMAAEWQKVVAAQLANLENVLGELGKLEAKGVEQLVGTWEEAGRYAKDSLLQAEKIGGEWRKLGLEAARRAAQVIAPKQP
jgi:hypothetical protein